MKSPSFSALPMLSCSINERKDFEQSIREQMERFIPDDFEVPLLFEDSTLRIRPLTINDVIKDYDAVMTSRDVLQGVFGPLSTWPQKELTLEQDLVDLGWHQKEFQKRSSFAYTVMTPDELTCLGCVYFYPSNNPNFDAMVIAWIRKSALHLDHHLLRSVRTWLKNRWPFERAGFPGRDISWREWLSDTGVA